MKKLEEKLSFSTNYKNHGRFLKKIFWILLPNSLMKEILSEKSVMNKRKKSFNCRLNSSLTDLNKIPTLFQMRTTQDSILVFWAAMLKFWKKRKRVSFILEKISFMLCLEKRMLSITLNYSNCLRLIIRKQLLMSLIPLTQDPKRLKKLFQMSYWLNTSVLLMSTKLKLSLKILNLKLEFERKKFENFLTLN